MITSGGPCHSVILWSQIMPVAISQWRPGQGPRSSRTPISSRTEPDRQSLFHHDRAVRNSQRQPKNYSHALNISPETVLGWDESEMSASAWPCLGRTHSQAHGCKVAGAAALVGPRQISAESGFPGLGVSPGHSHLMVSRSLMEDHSREGATLSIFSYELILSLGSKKCLHSPGKVCLLVHPELVLHKIIKLYFLLPVAKHH